MRLLNAVALTFNVRADEARLVLLLRFHSFLVGIARHRTRTAASALLLAEFSAQTLPYVHVAIGAETTGPITTVKNVAWELDLGDIKKFEEPAKRLEEWIPLVKGM